jgi:hypothetical protein
LGIELVEEMEILGFQFGRTLATAIRGSC